MLYRILLSAAVLCTLAACASTAPPASPEPRGVGDVTLQQGAPQRGEPALDVGIVVFDAGLPEDPAQYRRAGIYPEIRKAEARYLPFLLRDALVDSNAWGAVRVLPEEDASQPLQITGRILVSDGLRLGLFIKASDSSGRVWLARDYYDTAGEDDYVGDALTGEDPYADLYRRIANDLLVARKQLASTELQRLLDIATLSYAAGLAPQLFASYLGNAETGVTTLLRLPADNDPMLARIAALRNKQYLFIDTVDEKYRRLYDEMSPSYRLWRQFGREIAVYREDFGQRLASRDRDGQRGSYSAMEQAYNAYRWSKQQDEDMDELALGFNNEVAPTAMEVQGSVIRLSGSLAEQYAEWRRILTQLFLIESGLEAPATQVAPPN